MIRILIILVAFVLLMGLWIGVSEIRDGDAVVEGSITVAEALATDTTGFERAQGLRTFSFPADHGPHPDFKTEWWYFTGNVETVTGRNFGYQFTIFRIALAPQDSLSPRTSDWATNQLFMAHFTVSDIAAGKFYAFERFSRGAAGLSGAQADPFRIWLENWSAHQIGDSIVPLRVTAEQEGIAIDLTLNPTKPIVLQGDKGYDRKGSRPGDASYYYSWTRFHTTGQFRIELETYDVSGLSWMDREWSTSALDEDQTGWDWFSLHLSDGSDLMFYQIREQGGGISPFSDGVLVSPTGEVRSLAADEVVLRVIDHWQSPRNDARYPSKWSLSVPTEGIDLEIEPFLDDQELDVSVRYWEGAVHLHGRYKNEPIEGKGYVEMTGYGTNDARRT